MEKMIQRSITVSKEIDNWVKEYASKYGLKVSQAYRMLVVKARDAENATETLTGLVEQLSSMKTPEPVPAPLSMEELKEKKAKLMLELAELAELESNN